LAPPVPIFEPFLAVVDLVRTIMKLSQYNQVVTHLIYAMLKVNLTSLGFEDDLLSARIDTLYLFSSNMKVCSLLKIDKWNNRKHKNSTIALTLFEK